jgi:uncharacterized damage-inducible protein DinB
MTPAELLTDAFGRILEEGCSVLDGLSDGQLTRRPTDGANSIAWLLWHTARIQDDHIADAAGLQQVWAARGYVDDFALDLPEDDTGYGHTPEQVGRVRASAEQLEAYLAATHRQTIAWVGGLSADDLDRVVDEHWDPPVTLGVRLVSVVNDGTQHVGQAAYLRGLLS